MKYLIPVLVGGAAITAAVTTAIAQAHQVFNGNAPLTPYLYGYGAAALLLLLAVVVAVNASRQESKSQAPPPAPPPVEVHQDNKPIIKQEANPQFYFGSEFFQRKVDIDSPPTSPAPPNLHLGHPQMFTMYLVHDEWIPAVHHKSRNAFPRYSVMMAELKNIAEANTGPAHEIKAELVLFAPDNSVSVYGPLSWAETDCNTVNIEIGDGQYLLLAALMPEPQRTDVRKWRMVLNRRSRASDSPGVHKLVFAEMPYGKEHVLRLRIIQPSTKSVPFTFDGRLSWRGDEPIFQFSSSSESTDY